MTACPDPLRIRHLGEADEPAVSDLERTGFRHPWTAAMVAAELAHPTAFALGAEEHGRLLAYALFRRVGVEAELARIAVDPAVRRRGLARRLLGASLKELDAEGVLQTFLEVRTSNRAARALYTDLEFRTVGRRPNYYPDGTDALVMLRRHPQREVTRTS